MKKALLLLPLLALGSCILYEPRRTVIPAREPFTTEEIVALANGGTTEDGIRRELSIHGLDHALTADEIVRLKDAGLSDAMIKTIIQTPVMERRPETVVYDRPYRSHSYYYSDHDHGHAAFTLGALFGWALGHGGHHHGYRRSTYGSRW